MLLDLRIQNLVLMTSCHLALAEGFTALTGESGAGKTAILHSLKLLLGQKLDPSLIRFGETKGWVEGRFRLPSSLSLLLQEVGIEVEEELLVTREVYKEGKSRQFINNRAVSLAFLQKVSAHLIQIVDQSSYLELRQLDQQRHLLDLYGELEQEVKIFEKLFTELKECKKKEDALAERERQKEREFSFCLAQKKELSSFSLEEGEEEALFAEYANASNAGETLSKTEEVLQLLETGPGSTLTSLHRARKLCALLSPPLFEEPKALLETTVSSLEEVIFLLRKALSTFELEPHRLEFLEERLSSIERMKKKYGKTLADWKAYKEELEHKLSLFHALEEEKTLLMEEVVRLEEELNNRAHQLTSKRRKTADAFSQELHKELKELNMGEALVEIKIEPQSRTSFGDDKISFFLKANQGEQMTCVRDSSSGGELSRLLLACKICLAQNNQTPTLIFDEIDANVGGTTARKIGEKLLALSHHRQVLCITHFPQVACQAHLQIQIEKTTTEGRTLATARSLEGSEREKELLRMLGGKKEGLTH